MPDENVFERHAVLSPAVPPGHRARPRASSTVSPYLSKLEAFAAPPVADNQGILVTIFLVGGNDGLNMVSPVTDPAYAALRPNLKIMNGYSVGGGLALHPSLVKTKSALRPGQRRDRPRRRLPAGRPQSLLVDRHLDARMGWRRHADDRLARSLSRPPPERRARVALRRRVCTAASTCTSRAPSRTRRRSRSTSATRSASTAPTRRTRGCTTSSSGWAAARRVSVALGDLYNTVRDGARAARAADPHRVRLRRPDTDIAQQMVLAAQPHQREPRDPRDRHRARRLRHALRISSTFHATLLSTSRHRDRGVLHGARSALAEPGHDHDVLGVRRAGRRRPATAVPTTAPRPRCS